MKTVSIEEFRAHVDAYLIQAERENVVLTRGDKPCVLLQPIAGQSGTESDDLLGSPEFWRMIQERRNEAAVAWEEAKKSLEVG